MFTSHCVQYSNHQLMQSHMDTRHAFQLKIKSHFTLNKHAKNKNFEKNASK